METFFILMMWMDHGDIHAAFNGGASGNMYNVLYETEEACETELIRLLGDGVGREIGPLRPDLGLDIEKSLNSKYFYK